MTFGGDNEPVKVPDEILGADDEAVLGPIFVGHRMEAELVRSLLEANGIPAVIFGTGGFAFGAEDAGPNERVMVRSDHVTAALEAIRSADVPEGELVQPDADDFQLVIGEDYLDTDEYDEDDDAPWDFSQDADVLAQGSDWGPRIVGLVGVAALVAVIVVIVVNAT
jgi:hypothetical protein